MGSGFGYLSAVSAILAVWLSAALPTDANRMHLRRPNSLVSDQLQDNADEGFFLTSINPQWQRIAAYEVAAILERMRDKVSSLPSGMVSMSQLGVSDWNTNSRYRLEANGAGQGIIEVTLGTRYLPDALAAEVNRIEGNYFAGVFNGAQLIAPDGQVITVPNNVSGIQTGDLIVVVYGS